MKKAVLEVILVDAKGIKHTEIVGRAAYYVIVECGNHVYRSKISSGEMACWNEKFKFEFPLFDWKKLTHLKIKIMEKELFSHTGFVGQTIIYIGGIIREGCDKGLIEVKPGPYSVVLEDDSYKGEIRIGFKFISDISDVPKLLTKENIIVLENNNQPHVAIRSIVKSWKILRLWSLFFHKTMDKKNHKNMNDFDVANGNVNYV